MYPRTIIDSLPAVPNRDQLTHKDLHAHFSTGQSILLSGSGRDKKYGYRNGIQTDLGDIRNDVWSDLVRELIVRSHEEDLFDKLLEWEKEHTYWLKTKAELEHYTLELYAARIFDNPKWVDYLWIAEEQLKRARDSATSTQTCSHHPGCWRYTHSQRRRSHRTPKSPYSRPSCRTYCAVQIHRQKSDCAETQ